MDGWGGGFWLRNVQFPRSSHGERQRVVFVYLVHVRHLSMDLLGWVGGGEEGSTVGNDMVSRCSI